MLTVMDGRKKLDGSAFTLDRPVNPFNRRVQWFSDGKLPKWEAEEREQVSDTIGDPTYRKVFHNANYDVSMIRAGLGVDVTGRIEDTSIMARVCNSAEPSFKLKDLAWRYFEFPKDDMHEISKATTVARNLAKKQTQRWSLAQGNGAVQRDYWLLGHWKTLGTDATFYQRLIDYNIGDCFRTWLLFQLYERMIDEDPLLRETYELELELRPLILRMVDRGLPISYKHVMRERVIIQDKLADCYRRLERTAGEGFNPNSSAQLRKYMYTPTKKGGLGLSTNKKTKGGDPSTDWKALRPHWGIPFVWDVMQYKAYDKGTQVFDRFLAAMVPDGERHRVHPFINQVGTKHGRISSDLQQVPNPDVSIKGTDVTPARVPIRPYKGRVIVCADYEQMEAKVFAELAGIDVMLDAVANGRDMYTDLANELWGGRNNPKSAAILAGALEFDKEEPSSKAVAEAWRECEWEPRLSKEFGVRSSYALDSATWWFELHGFDIVKSEKAIGKKTMRNRSKMVTLAKQYGGGVSSLMDLLFCDEDEASETIADYDGKFPDARRFQRKLMKQVERDGYVIYTLWGRKVKVDPDKLYACVNYLVSGSCADLVKRAMLKSDRYLQMTTLDFHLMMQQHDELMFDASERHCTKPVLRRIKSFMEDTEGKITVPLSVEVSVCRESWAKKEKIEL